MAIHIDIDAVGVEAIDSPGANPLIKTKLQGYRKWCFAIAMMGNFVVIPLLATLHYKIKESDAIFKVAVATLILTVILFGVWFKLLYHTKHSPTKETQEGE